MTSPAEEAPWPPSSLLPLIRTLITASHILHHHSILDAYGHISVRVPTSTTSTNPGTFLLPLNLAPALLSSPSDIIEYSISSATPTNWVGKSEGKEAPKGYIERFIHSEVYKSFPGVGAVVHAHDGEVVPWTLVKAGSGGGVEGGGGGRTVGGGKEMGEGEREGVWRSKLKAVTHMSGFLGTLGVPCWDISHDYARPSHDGPKDLLIRNTNLGSSMASAFTVHSSPSAAAATDFPATRVLLLRGHGYTGVAEDLVRLVYTAMYTSSNAKVQFKAGEIGEEGVVVGLSEEEARDTWETMVGAAGRAWGLWGREVEAGGFYRNEV